MNWWATRDETYASPIVRGMARTRPGERARDRILSDHEVAALWRATATLDTFGSLVRMLLLTAQRRSEVAHMRRSEIRDGVWTVPAERYKTNRATAVPLPRLALEIVQAQPIVAGSDLVFTQDGRRPFGNFSVAKRKLDRAMVDELSRRSIDSHPREQAAALPQWQLHDLRRTARSLMSRGGVRPDIAERVLGHAISGVAGVDDRHSYEHEKATALKVLELQISKIVDRQGRLRLSRCTAPEISQCGRHAALHRADLLAHLVDAALPDQVILVSVAGSLRGSAKRPDPPRSAGPSALRGAAFERLDDIRPSTAVPDIDRLRYAVPCADDRECADLLSVKQLIVHEVHHPDLVRCRRRCSAIPEHFISVSDEAFETILSGLPFSLLVIQHGQLVFKSMNLSFGHRKQEVHLIGRSLLLAKQIVPPVQVRELFQ